MRGNIQLSELADRFLKQNAVYFSSTWDWRRRGSEIGGEGRRAAADVGGGAAAVCGWLKP